MFQIVVDSAANIPAETVKEYNIQVISFINYVDGKPLVCFDPDLTPEQEREKGNEYYKSVAAGHDIKTGLVSSGEFEDAFKKILDKGEDILYISLSKNISGTFNSARVASEDLLTGAYKDKGRKILLLDSLNASLAQGIIAIYASEMRAQGLSIDEVYEKLQSYPARMNGVFTVGDLKYLSKTGRISSSTALVGNLLNVKPILRGNKDGYIVQFKKCHGRKAALKELINLVCNNVEDPENQILGIAHAACYEESLYIMEEITKRIKCRRFINTSYDYCTGSHVGPDTIALFFMGKDRELSN